MATSRESGQCAALSRDERLRIEERFQATLAGIMELDLLKLKHQEMVEAALGHSGKQQNKSPRRDFSGHPQHQTELGDSDCYFQDQLQEGVSSLKLGRCHSQDMLSERTELIPTRSCLSSENLYKRSRTRTVPGILTTAFPENQLHSCSRTSSGFHDMSDSSTSIGSESSSELDWSESCHSPLHSIDESTTSLKDFRLQLGSGGNAWNSSQARDTRRPFSMGDIDSFRGFLPIADLCPQSHWSSVSTILQPQLGLSPKYRCDLISQNTREVYHYPSPLHAVALQSPLYTTAGGSQSLLQSSSREDLSEDSTSFKTFKTTAPVAQPMEQTPTRPSLMSDSLPTKSLISSCLRKESTHFSKKCKVDKYISKLVRRYRCQSAAARLSADVQKQQQEQSSAHHKSISLSSIKAVGDTSVKSDSNSIRHWKMHKQLSAFSLVKTKANRSSQGFSNSQDCLDGWHNSSRTTCSSTSSSGSFLTESRSQAAFNNGHRQGIHNFLPNFQKTLKARLSGDSHWSSSEMHLDSVGVWGGKPLSLSESQNILEHDMPRIHERQKWMSVLEVSSSSHSKGSAENPWHLQLLHSQGRSKRAPSRFGLAFPNQQQTFSTDCLSGLGSSQADLTADLRYNNQPGLSNRVEVDSSCSSLGGGRAAAHYILEGWGAKDAEARVHRAKTFGGLRKRMLNSVSVFSFKGNSLKK
ncbi:Dapper-like 2 [Acipenser ruthenus]|uniref:Dapper-like 2 n=1 Tax=Acipenser ruthenus TaxID=7906 RepID=A0A444TZ80_ACIRT|nr:Dapper-like 2 [Acipenser ruthenus]